MNTFVPSWTSPESSPTSGQRRSNGVRRVATRHELEIARDFGKSLEVWFRANGRRFPWRRWRDPYRLTVVEILLQRTRAGVVADFAPRFLRRYSNWANLAAAPPVVLEAELQALGLQKRRAAALLALARAMRSRDALPDESSPGVGQYVARAVRVGVLADRLAMVDGNFVRILRRAFGGEWMADYRYDPRLQGLAAALVSGARSARIANWAVLDLGAAVCTPSSPDCGACPLQDPCRFRASSGST